MLSVNFCFSIIKNMNRTNTEITSSVKVPQSENAENTEIPVFENCFQQTLSRPHSLITSCNNNGCKFSNKPYGFLNPTNNDKKLYAGIDQAYTGEEKEGFREKMEPVRSNYRYNFASKYPIGSKIPDSEPIQDLSGLQVMSQSVIERYRPNEIAELKKVIKYQEEFIDELEKIVVVKNYNFDRKVKLFTNFINGFGIEKLSKIIEDMSLSPGSITTNDDQRLFKIQNEHAKLIREIKKLIDNTDEHDIYNKQEVKTQFFEKLAKILKVKLNSVTATEYRMLKSFHKSMKRERFTIGDKEFDNKNTIIIIIVIILFIVVFWFVYRFYRSRSGNNNFRVRGGEWDDWDE